MTARFEQVKLTAVCGQLCLKGLCPRPCTAFMNQQHRCQLWPEGATSQLERPGLRLGTDPLKLLPSETVATVFKLQG